MSLLLLTAVLLQIYSRKSTVKKNKTDKTKKKVNNNQEKQNNQQQKPTQKQQKTIFAECTRKINGSGEFQPKISEAPLECTEKKIILLSYTFLEDL